MALGFLRLVIPKLFVLMKEFLDISSTLFSHVPCIIAQKVLE